MSNSDNEFDNASTSIRGHNIGIDIDSLRIASDSDNSCSVRGAEWSVPMWIVGYPLGFVMVSVQAPKLICLQA
jgi:hypothetical protein